MLWAATIHPLGRIANVTINEEYQKKLDAARLKFAEAMEKTMKAGDDSLQIPSDEP